MRWERGDVLSVIGAGGKTSLLFRLGHEIRQMGKRCLLTTSTRMLIPREEDVEALDLTGCPVSVGSCAGAGIFVTGLPVKDGNKMGGPALEELATARTLFDLMVIEADGSAGKPLKGWKRTEPVVAPFTSHTVGVVDIQAVGKIIDESFVHRLEKFMGISGCKVGDRVTTDHLLSMIVHERGLFAGAVGKKILYINKVESRAEGNLAQELQSQVPDIMTISGSIHQGRFYV